MKQLALLTLLIMFVLPACAHEQDSHQRVDRATVTGYGEVEAEPDQATLRITVMALGDNLAEAKREADRRYESVLKVLGKANIPDKQIKVVSLSMQPRYEWTSNQQVYKGEQVSRGLSITINNLDKIGPVMQALVENGVSTVDGISTGFQDRSALLKQALGAASKDARNKAEFLSDQLGRKLGQAIEIVEQNSGAPIRQYQDVRMAKSASMAESYQAPQEMFGTQTISASVTVSFKLD